MGKLAWIASVFIIAMMLPSLSSAEIYKCMVDGKLNFTDRPCAEAGSGSSVTRGVVSSTRSTPEQGQRKVERRSEKAEIAIQEFGSGGSDLKSEFTKKCVSAGYETFLALKNPNPSARESADEMADIERRCSTSEAKLQADKASGRKSYSQIRREMTYDDQLKECIGLKHYQYLVENNKITVKDGALVSEEISPDMEMTYGKFCRERLAKGVR